MNTTDLAAIAANLEPVLARGIDLWGTLCLGLAGELGIRVVDLVAVLGAGTAAWLGYVRAVRREET